jgi:DNA-binding transcriptional regulator LsrR (DeoR family)
LSERLITFSLHHPIAACMELAAQLAGRFDLRLCEVVPSDPASDDETLGIAENAATLIEHHLRSPEPMVLAFGTGRTLRAAVEQVPRMEAGQHKLVSLVGHISMEGAGSFFDVLTRLSDLTKAPHYPMPLPVVVPSRKDRDQLVQLEPFRRLRDLAGIADISIVGIGRMDERAQIHLDGFISSEELNEMRRAGAIGEITGWSFDAAGRLIQSGINERLTSVPLDTPATRMVVGVAQGTGKILAIHAALKGRLINGLITNETTARSLLDLG